MNALKIGVEVYFGDHGIFPSVDRSPIIQPKPRVIAAEVYGRGWDFCNAAWMAPERRYGSIATKPSGSSASLSVMPPIAIEEIQRRDWARWGINDIFAPQESGEPFTRRAATK